MNPLEALGLRGLHAPPAPDAWPPAPGWWLLGAAMLLGAITALGAWRRWRRRAGLRRAAAGLAAVQQAWTGDRDAGRCQRALSAWLRQVCIERYPREQVAGLTGEAWLAWLDRPLGDGQFSAGPGRALLEAPYRPAPRDPSELLQLCRRWLRALAGERRPC